MPETAFVDSQTGPVGEPPVRQSVAAGESHAVGDFATALLTELDEISLGRSTGPASDARDARPRTVGALQDYLIGRMLDTLALQQGLPEPRITGETDPMPSLANRWYAEA